MIVYMVSYKNCCDVEYTSIFTTKEKAENFVAKLRNSGLDLIIEQSFCDLEQDEETANFFFEQFKSIYTDEK